MPYACGRISPLGDQGASFAELFTPAVPLYNGMH